MNVATAYIQIVSQGLGHFQADLNTASASLKTAVHQWDASFQGVKKVDIATPVAKAGTEVKKVNQEAKKAGESFSGWHIDLRKIEGTAMSVYAGVCAGC